MGSRPSPWASRILGARFNDMYWNAWHTCCGGQLTGMSKRVPLTQDVIVGMSIMNGASERFIAMLSKICRSNIWHRMEDWPGRGGGTWGVMEKNVCVEPSHVEKKIGDMEEHSFPRGMVPPDQMMDRLSIHFYSRPSSRRNLFGTLLRSRL